LLGFVLSRNDGAFLHNNLSENEVAAIHECLSWGRQRGNNPVLDFFGTTFEAYQHATDTLVGRLRSVLPEGSTKCKIRATARQSREPVGQGTLLDTLGDETVGVVMVDPGCVSPFRYDQLEIMNGIVGQTALRIRVEEASVDGKYWKKVDRDVDTSGLDDQWKSDFAGGAALFKETWVRNSEAHYDAKVGFAPFFKPTSYWYPRTHS